ncbi:MAG: DUF3631 domain-containing protein [Gammaproteobacteria bacterium]|nr:DUF3631 domain-containing protein [Gammaproteobacteria bacterium]
MTAGALHLVVPDQARAVDFLATLSPIEYDRRRDALADVLSCRVSSLDTEVAQRRPQAAAQDGGQGRAFTITEPEPWPHPVDGAALLDELASVFRRFVVLPDHGDTIAALWALHSYAFDRGHITPILVIDSPEKGCGKTTLRDVLAQLVRSALSTDGISSAAVFRIIEKWRPTLLLDDFDSWGRENEELRGVLNTGYRKGGAYVRCVGDDSEPRGFLTFAPKCINLIGRLHPTLHDRAVTITMRRKLRGEAVESLHGFDGEELRRKCARLVQDNGHHIEVGNPAMPQGLFNRQADNWRPLLVLAEIAGGQWPEKARRAALAAVNSNTDNESLGVALLADIREIFGARSADRLPTDMLIRHLVAIEEKPWGDLRGNPIDSRSLARLLRPFGILPGTIRIGEKTVKGYHLDRFEDAFGRYLASESVTTSQPCKTSHFLENSSVTRSTPVTDRNAENALKNGHCDAVTDTDPFPPEEGDPGPFGDAVAVRPRKVAM